MRIFLDTASMDEIRAGVRLGVVSGVTTNPSLMARESGVDFGETIRAICDLVRGPVSAEVTAPDAEGMVAQAREIARWSEYVVVKVPITAEGLAAISVLADEGIPTNATLIFSANQALLAALAGAAYVSPFVGRLDDINHDGMQVVVETAEIFERHDLDTQIIAASIRHPLHVTQAALAGAHIATVPYKVLMQMIQHPLTDRGIERFLADWAKFIG
ncbi:MAG: fructose-6-phosphate aldolase [Chloroflexi bacterium]|nr:fructose-6-phosphate aldolase [Chloroflexota bacterium]MBU1750887.1 fructose-6-phosphate aldolase [Chloroflexota bacterium]MBU1879480.1 fructose-6-phosphate aldolase [Chloroflexota bacterium]